MNKSKIEWCDSTWNPVTGCLHGCEYCYARRIANRFYNPNFDGFDRLADGSKKIVDKPIKDWHTGSYIPYPFCFEPTFHRYRLQEPEQKTKPQNIFVCSMADLFGDWVPDEWIQEVFKACEAAPQHRYLFLTKNPKRYRELYLKKVFPYKENFWFGTTCTTPRNEFAWFKNTPYHSFVSIEPLLADFGKINMDIWPELVIIGAQTGPGSKQPEPKWVQSIIDQCRAAGVPVFLKNNLNWPEKIQEFPWDERMV